MTEPVQPPSGLPLSAAAPSDGLADGARVGPYRIDHQLGQGGMGEVYAGYDERLERAVALKRVRPGDEIGTRAQRLRREARLAAKLRHPSIVQVHDWVEEPTGEWIVMELIEGYSLRHVLYQGPLEPGRVLNLARQILRGLAAAHGAGVVHRDLKPENVMLTRGETGGEAEQVKILDFGIAGRFGGDIEETRLTREGQVAGTMTAMAPEQVLGRPVDPRTDLFALGSILYEALTGLSPFRAEAPGVIVHRICTVKPMSPHLLDPMVPSGLSAFVEHLMEKDPQQRPQSAEEALRELDMLRSGERVIPTESLAETLPSTTYAQPEAPRFAEPSQESHETPQTLPDAASKLDVDQEAHPPQSHPSQNQPSQSQPSQSQPSQRMRSWWPAALVVVVITLLVAGLPWGRLQAPGEPLYVVVPETDLNLLGGATAGESGAADEELALVASSVHTALLRGLLGLRGVAVLESPRHTDSWDDATSLARVAGAGEVLVSRLECGGRNCQVVLRRLRGEDGEILWTESFSVDNRQLLSTSQAVLGHLRQGYSERSVREGVAELEAQSADYEEYLRVRYRYEQRQEGYSVDELLRDLERIEQTSPRFLMPSLLRIKVLVRRFQEQRHADDLLAAKSALERARSLAPHDPQVLARAVQLARIDNRLDDAWSYLEELKLLEPGNALALLHEARLLERQGRNEEAVAIMREAVQRIPSVDYYSDLADLLYRQGDVDGARQSLEQGLTRAPDSFSARSRLAQIELLSGSAARAAELYEELVRRSPEVTELTNLGTAYLLMQRNSEAAEQFRRAFELGPSSPYAALNLADAELLLGNEQEAAQLYERVVELADADPQPDMLLTVRAQAEAHLGRHEDAVASVQTALRRSPDNPQTLYEAALVYALVGDLASALVNARQALRQGIEPRWFSFSWFDELRPHLALADA